jgi:hypothetical protein
METSEFMDNVTINIDMYSYVCVLFLLVKKGSMDEMDPVGLGGEGSPGRFRKSASTLAGGAGNNGAGVNECLYVYYLFMYICGAYVRIYLKDTDT